MGRKKQITPRKRAIIGQYIRDGLKQKVICERLQLPQATVSHIMKKFKETGSVDAGKSTGRSRVTTVRDDTAIKICSKKNPSYSSVEIKNEAKVMASCRTIRRRLSKEFGLSARRPAKKPMLNKKQRDKRLVFCKKYKHWTEKEWSKVLFSDETTICQFGNNACLVRRPMYKRYCPQYTVPTMKHPPKIMVWGSFAASGRGSLYFIDANKTVNTAEYIKILESKLKMSMTIHKCDIFQQDSAPAHVSKVAKNWFRTNGIQILDWPGNSPDLNPIENLWMLLKRKLRQYNPSNIQELIYHIKRVWCTEMSPEVCRSLVFSMPQRVKAVIQNKGYSTKY